MDVFSRVNDPIAQVLLAAYVEYAKFLFVARGAWWSAMTKSVADQGVASAVFFTVEHAAALVANAGAAYLANGHDPVEYIRVAAGGATPRDRVYFERVAVDIEARSAGKPGEVATMADLPPYEDVVTL